MIVHIATGSNLGDRINHLDAADAALNALGRVLRISPTYETAAIGMAPGTPDFLNRVVELALDDRWESDPEGLMQALLRIEQDMGRTRTRGAVISRPIDLDIVLWGERSLDVEGLTVPHPRMMSRRFVLQPLVDVAPELRVEGRSIQAALERCPDAPSVVLRESVSHEESQTDVRELGH